MTGGLKLYEKYYHNNFEELLTYYPRFYRDVLEMVEILKAQGRLADALEADIEQTFLNSFIDYADEAAIGRLEIFLKIGLNTSWSLEERRQIVKSYFIGAGRISASVLAQMLQSIVGCPDPNIRLEPIDAAGNNALLIDFDCPENAAQKLAIVKEVLAKKVPAHIPLLVTAIFPPVKVPFYVGGAVSGGIMSSELPQLVWEQPMQQNINVAAQAENIMLTDLPQLAWRQGFAENIFAAAERGSISETELSEIKGEVR